MTSSADAARRRLRSGPPPAPGPDVRVSRRSPRHLASMVADALQRKTATISEQSSEHPKATPQDGPCPAQAQQRPCVENLFATRNRVPTGPEAAAAAVIRLRTWSVRQNLLGGLQARATREREERIALHARPSGRVVRPTHAQPVQQGQRDDDYEQYEPQERLPAPKRPPS